MTHFRAASATYEGINKLSLATTPEVNESEISQFWLWRHMFVDAKYGERINAQPKADLGEILGKGEANIWG